MKFLMLLVLSLATVSAFGACELDKKDGCPSVEECSALNKNYIFDKDNKKCYADKTASTGCGDLDSKGTVTTAKPTTTAAPATSGTAPATGDGK